jgi:hypothetical protein
MIGTDEGVVYTLRYGGPVFAEGDELVIGSSDDAEQKKDSGAPKDKAKKSATVQENRYLMVTVSFDPTLIEKPDSTEPKPVTKPVPPATLPDNVFAPDPKDPKYLADQKAKEDKVAKDQADYEKKIVDGKKKVDDFIARFGPWYYVTSGQSFGSINLDRVSLVEPKKTARRRRCPRRTRRAAQRAAPRLSAPSAAIIVWELSVVSRFLQATQARLVVGRDRFTKPYKRTCSSKNLQLTTDH